MDAKICLSEAGFVCQRQETDYTKSGRINAVACQGDSGCGQGRNISITELHCMIRGGDSTSQSNDSPVLFETPVTDEQQPSSTNRISSLHEEPPIVPAKTTIGSDCYACPPEMKCIRDLTKDFEGVASFMALIIEVGSITEIMRKNGPKRGEPINTSSLTVADPTTPLFSITLWRECAVTWTERLSAGDIVLLTGIRVKRAGSKGVVGNSTFDSGVLNLHQPRKLPDSLSGRVPPVCFAEFVKWAWREHYYLFENHKIPKSQRLVTYAHSSDLRSCDIVNTIIHFRGKLVSFVNQQGRSVFITKPYRLCQAFMMDYVSVVIGLSDDPMCEVLVSIVGRDSDKRRACLAKGVGSVWDIKYLQVLPECTQATGMAHLQVTSVSSFRLMKHNDPITLEILQKWDVPVKDSTISQLLTTPTSGYYRITVSSVNMSVAMETKGVELSLDTENLSSVLPYMVYSGCGQCASELQKDMMCSGCGHVKTQVFYYRSLIITLLDDVGGSIAGKADHKYICNIFQDCGIQPSQLVRPLNELVLKSVGERLSFLLHGNGVWSVCIDMRKDENSFVEFFDCKILDWKNQ